MRTFYKAKQKGLRVVSVIQVVQVVRMVRIISPDVVHSENEWFVE